jgi:hypothetical protein
MGDTLLACKPLGTFGMLCDKTHLIADCELVERLARDACCVANPADVNPR